MEEGRQAGPATPEAAWVRTVEPLIWFLGAGREIRSSTAYFFDSRIRHDPEHVVLQLTLGGVGFYETARGRSLLPRGTALLDVIPGPFTYGYAMESDGPYEHVYVSMTGPVAKRWCGRIVRRFGNVLKFGEDNDVEPLMISLANRRRDGTMRDRYATSGLLYQLFMTVLSTLSATRVATEPRMARAMELISRNAASPRYSVSSLAAELDCSREYLARWFRSVVGVSPSDYLTQHRLRLAARELRSSSSKLESIARRTGFSGANYFCRVFRKHLGVTPAQFRARPWIAEP